MKGKIKRVLAVLLMVLLLFTACANTDSSAPSSAEQNEGMDSTPTGVASSDDNQLAEKYLDVTKLAALDMSVDEKYVFDDRTFIMEDSIDNELELLVFNYYFDISAAKFDELMELIGENESLQIVTKNQGDNFAKGYYRSEYTIHELDTLTTEDLKDVSEFGGKLVLDEIKTFSIEKYAIVRVDVSWRYNEQYLAQGPQLDDGRYMRYFLIAETANTDGYKIFEVCWEDFIENTK